MKRRGTSGEDDSGGDSAPCPKKLAPIFVKGSARGVSNSKEASGTPQRSGRNMSDKGMPWAHALREIALRPEKLEQKVLELTDDAVLISDVYPKARKHYLVIARKDGLDAISDVRKEELPILQHMHELGKAWAESCLKEDPSLVFRLGYHSVPSMRQLHLHVISQDFDSPSLKNKKHWNSFTTSFFRDSKDVLAEIEQNGRVQPCSTEVADAVNNAELRCHRCKSVQRNMPQLKSHIKSCNKPFPTTFVQDFFIRAASMDSPS